MNIYLVSTLGLPFAVRAMDKEPKERKNKKRKMKIDKNTCNKCNKRSSLTGHILCITCKQWKHLKCVGLNLSEAQLKKANYKYDNCK